ncbi:hypothetical protein QBZ16_004706 [Prototheca wickerhamii]|uniref:beta-galactosidase n=1 Tax=Prototheca wickerhamii TaxID=3111 RepID=A0AAD9MKW1_PROWI|nr:hypothetical protein QBZ16_004706 [Prototheca wickerhamii]
MGLNAITVYVAWNVHEPEAGRFDWDGQADLAAWLTLAAEEGLLAVLRPGPYICAEWDFGGLPWWLASKKISGGRTMRLRSSDPAYLQYVDRFWHELFDRLRPLTYKNGGPIIMAQIENEYGFCGDDKDYIRHLIGRAKEWLGPEVLLFTTDPPSVAARGSIAGDEILTVVDFGPQNYNLDYNFGVAKRLNGADSPLFNSEFYTGWLSHWGERMANTSAAQLTADTANLLAYGGGNTSLSFYMVHGGTNFGFAQGANIDGNSYQPHITSYDYDSPISEAGTTASRASTAPANSRWGWELRATIERHLGVELPQAPAPPPIVGYGKVPMTSSISLFDALGALAPTPVRGSALTMEDYDQRWGLILYRHLLDSNDLRNASTLNLGAAPHDYATVGRR